MAEKTLENAMATIPAGAWAVGVSGGADSVALLTLLQPRTDLHLVVVHLNHQTRGEETEQDAAFVAVMAKNLGIECITQTRAVVETWRNCWPPNRSAFFRALRLELFSRIVREHNLSGVVLGHHREDQAETVLQRLLRGSGYQALAGIQPDTTINNLRIVRPLLTISRAQLRDRLTRNKIPWREDTSNASPAYNRNRVRHVLTAHGDIIGAMIDLARSCGDLSQWVQGAAPVLGATFSTRQLADLPQILAEHAARHWLISQGVPETELSAAIAYRLITMALDAATPAHSDFPGPLRVARRKGQIASRGLSS